MCVRTVCGEVEGCALTAATVQTANSFISAISAYAVFLAPLTGIMVFVRAPCSC